MTTLEKIISEHLFFKGLKNEHISSLVKCASFSVFDKDKYIFSAQEEAKYFYLILEGSVSLQIFSHERGTVRLEAIEEGQFLGWSWLFPPYKWQFDAKTLEHTRVIIFDAQALKIVMAQDWELGFKIHKLFTQLIIQRLQTLRYKFLDVLEKYPQIEFEEISIINITSN